MEAVMTEVKTVSRDTLETELTNFGVIRFWKEWSALSTSQ